MKPLWLCYKRQASTRQALSNRELSPLFLSSLQPSSLHRCRNINISSAQPSRELHIHLDTSLSRYGFSLSVFSADIRIGQYFGLWKPYFLVRTNSAQ